jgi:hypothetical protein
LLLVMYLIFCYNDHVCWWFQRILLGGLWNPPFSLVLTVYWSIA